MACHNFTFSRATNSKLTVVSICFISVILHGAVPCGGTIFLNIFNYLTIFKVVRDAIFLAWVKIFRGSDRGKLLQTDKLNQEMLKSR